MNVANFTEKKNTPGFVIFLCVHRLLYCAFFILKGHPVFTSDMKDQGQFIFSDLLHADHAFLFTFSFIFFS